MASRHELQHLLEEKTILPSPRDPHVRLTSPASQTTTRLYISLSHSHTSQLPPSLQRKTSYAFDLQSGIAAEAPTQLSCLMSCPVSDRKGYALLTSTYSMFDPRRMHVSFTPLHRICSAIWRFKMLYRAAPPGADVLKRYGKD